VLEQFVSVLSVFACSVTLFKEAISGVAESSTEVKCEIADSLRAYLK